MSYADFPDQIASGQYAPWYVKPLMRLLPPGAAFTDMVGALVFRSDLQGCLDVDPDKAKRLFKEHNEAVKQVCHMHWMLVVPVQQASMGKGLLERL